MCTLAMSSTATLTGTDGPLVEVAMLLQATHANLVRVGASGMAPVASSVTIAQPQAAVTAPNYHQLLAAVEALRADVSQQAALRSTVDQLEQRLEQQRSHEHLMLEQRLAELETRERERAAAAEAMEKEKAAAAAHNVAWREEIDHRLRSLDATLQSFSDRLQQFEDAPAPTLPPPQQLPGASAEAEWPRLVARFEAVEQQLDDLSSLVFELRVASQNAESEAAVSRPAIDAACAEGLEGLKSEVSALRGQLEQLQKSHAEQACETELRSEELRKAAAVLATLSEQHSQLRDRVAALAVEQEAAQAAIHTAADAVSVRLEARAEQHASEAVAAAGGQFDARIGRLEGDVASALEEVSRQMRALQARCDEVAAAVAAAEDVPSQPPQMRAADASTALEDGPAQVELQPLSSASQSLLACGAAPSPSVSGTSPFATPRGRVGLTAEVARLQRVLEAGGSNMDELERAIVESELGEMQARLAAAPPE